METTRGTIYFDAACGICTAGATRFERLLLRRGFALEPLQNPGVTELLGLPPGHIPDEIQLQTRDARIVTGADAMVYIARQIWWAWPMWVISKLPGAMPQMRRAYGLFAQNRHRISRACALEPSDNSVLRWAPPVALVGATIWLCRGFDSWVYMWMLAVAMFAACKWITFWPIRKPARIGRMLAYFFAFPGMDARAFFAAPRAIHVPARDYIGALAKLAAGVTMTWLLARIVARSSEFAAAWCAMVGLVLMLHFGLLQLIALWWRSAGFDVAPLMNRPLLARSLADFWGRRWNTGFSVAVRDVVFHPLSRRAGPGLAIALVFLISGIVHDIAISVPARGGYGLPTAYFLLQLIGLALARTRLMRRAGLSSGTVGARIYTFAFTLAPMPLLFHRAFVTDVMIPFAHAIGAI